MTQQRVAAVSAAPDPVIVIGNGPVGVHLVNELHRLGYAGRLRLFGEEPHAPYNRVQLSNMLSGGIAGESLAMDVSLCSQWQAHYHTRIVEIDPEKQVVVDNFGRDYSFGTLVLATGSRPHVPSLPGTGLDGVFAFRDLNDAHRLMSRQASSRHTVVIGGGLLGIETARAMTRHGTKVTLLHHSPALMNRQLDERASERLTDFLATHGVSVRTDTAVMAIDGSRKVERILLRGDAPIACDTVIFATGIRPNIDLARQAGLAVGQGVRINDRLQTSNDSIYAVGECTQFEDRIFGLVSPGLEQAAVLARSLSGIDRDSRYRGSMLAASLKVLETPVFSLGEVGQEFETRRYQEFTWESDGQYRKLVLDNGRLVGAIGLGDWPERETLAEAIRKRRYLPFWRRWMFASRGLAFGGAAGAASLPNAAIICNCRQVDAGTIRSVANEGHRTVEAVGEACGAGTVCGSCHPLLGQLTGGTAVATASQRALALWSLVAAALLALIVALPPFPVAQSYESATLDPWWTETARRQVTGFTMLGLMTIGLIVGLRKRIPRFRWLSFARWRWIHVLLSTAALGVVFLHTGLSATQGLNQWLLITFWTAAAVGVLTALLSHLESVSPSVASKTLKRWCNTAHLIAFWPLPVLITFHILTVYWF